MDPFAYSASEIFVSCENQRFFNLCKVLLERGGVCKRGAGSGAGSRHSRQQALRHDLIPAITLLLHKLSERKRNAFLFRESGLANQLQDWALASSGKAEGLTLMNVRACLRNLGLRSV